MKHPWSCFLLCINEAIKQKPKLFLKYIAFSVALKDNSFYTAT